jgi:hypothetical protein
MVSLKKNSSGSADFDQFRDYLASDGSLKRELEDALLANINRLNPSDRANRFGSGGAVEWILAAAFYQAGVIVLPGGHGQNGADLNGIRDDFRSKWSVKNTSKKSDFRLSNGMGGTGKGFSEPVLLLSPALPGIVYADPSLHSSLKNSCVKTGDAVVLPFAAVEQFAKNNVECVAPCSMPANQGVGTDDPWMDYVKSLLEPKRFPRLSKLFSAANPSTSSVADVVAKLVVLRDGGKISNVQFDELLGTLT